MPFDAMIPPEAPRPLLIERVLDAVRRSRDFIAGGRWCAGHLEDDQGNHCAVGWILWHEQHTSRGFIQYIALPYLWRALPKSARKCRDASSEFGDLTTYNDSHTRRSVVRLFDRAIAAMEADATAQRLVANQREAVGA